MLLIRTLQKAVNSAVINYNTHNYQYATKSKNRWLFSLLKVTGFFNLFSSNNGHIVYIHQVVAFIHYGKDWLRHGYQIRRGEYEVHHLNSIPFDNNPHNLVIVSCADHRAVHEAMNQSYLGFPLSLKPTPINRQGKLVSNHKHFVVDLFKQTMELTLNSAGISAPPFDSVDALLRFPTSIYSQFWGNCFTTNTSKAISKKIKQARSLKTLLGDSILDVMRFIFAN